MEANVIKHGWDGEWFLRAMILSKERLAQKCERKILLNLKASAQWQELGKPRFRKKALDSGGKIFNNDYGVELLYPTYKKYHIELGEISSYPPGYKENGSVFTHNNPWIVIANTVIGENERAFDVYKRNCPAFLEDISEIHKTEPYVYSQTIAGRDAKNYGEAKNSFLTGSASWSFVAATQEILGIKPDYAGLRIEPHLPKEMTNVKVTRIFRGIKYNIEIFNNNTPNQMFVDGKKIEETLIPYHKSSKEVYVKVYI